MATQQQTDFVQRFWCYAVYIGAVIRWTPQLVMATWAGDTGFGVATGMMNCHALLGIVCAGNCPECPCNLCNESLCFYCYPSFDRFFSVYAAVTNQHQYDVVRAQSTPDAQAQALALQTGFAGGSSTYLALLRSVMAIEASIQKPASCGGNPPPPPPAPVPIPDGQIVTHDAANGRVWIIVAQHRREIIMRSTPGDTFAACGYDFRAIRAYDSARVLAMPAGANITGPPDCPYGNPPPPPVQSAPVLGLALLTGGALALVASVASASKHKML